MDKFHQPFYSINSLFHKILLDLRIWVNVTKLSLLLDPLKYDTGEYLIEIDLSNLDWGKATSSVHSSHHTFKYDPFECSMYRFHTRYKGISQIRFDELSRMRKMYFTLVVSALFLKVLKVFFDSVFLMLQIQYNRPAKQQNFVYLLKATFK